MARRCIWLVAAASNPRQICSTWFWSLRQTYRPRKFTRIAFLFRIAYVVDSEKKNASARTMIEQMKQFWDEFVHPAIQRPRHLQVAALCYRDMPEGKKVLLITSRDTGRWIIPKGWPVDGLDAQGSALHEAWEEAGVSRGDPAPKAIGSYQYKKEYPNDWSLPVETIVFPVSVRALEDDFPESGERERRWVSSEDAANLVVEPGLKAILRSF